MRIHNDLKPELCAARERGRYAITETYLDGDKIIATDGRRLTVVPVKLERHDANGFIQPDAYKDARAVAKKQFPRSKDFYGMEANGAVKLDNGATLQRPIDGVFPRWRQVVPKTPPTITIGLNTNYLAEIAAAIGAGKGTEADGVIYIDIADPSQPYVIHRGDRGAAGAAYGVLMPACTRKDSDWNSKTPDYYGAEITRELEACWNEALAENTRVEFDRIIPAAAKGARFEHDWHEAEQLDFRRWAATTNDTNVSAAIYTAHLEACGMNDALDAATRTRRELETARQQIETLVKTTAAEMLKPAPVTLTTEESKIAGEIAAENNTSPRAVKTWMKKQLQSIPAGAIAF